MKNSILLIFLCCAQWVIAQGKEERADGYFNDFKFDKAIDLYRDLAAEKRKPSLHIIERLADSYFNIGDYHSAKEWYGKLYAIKGKDIEEGQIIKLVQCLKADRENTKADDILKGYYREPKKLEMIMTQKAHLDSILMERPVYGLTHMEFNSKKSDFAPTYYKNGIVFASARDTLKSRELYPWNKQPYLDLYFTNPDSEGFVPEKFLENMESSYHDATIAFSWDTRTVYFTRNYLQKNKLSANAEGLSNMHILKGTISGNALVNVTSLSFNSKDYSCGHPALSEDGSKLYFTSNMPGGYGESDIYVVGLNSTGDVVGPPTNLGPVINTRGREMFPFIGNDILYFSSDGHYGLGGLDVFASAILSGPEYSLPLNRGEPINSNMDDFSYVRQIASNNGYVASNRYGGTGDDDIYYFEKLQPVDCLEYSGYVLDEKTGEPIPMADAELYHPEKGLVMALKTNDTGYYSFVLPCDQNNRMVFSKDKYSKKTVMHTTNSEPGQPSINNRVYLTPFESLIVKEGDVEKIKVDPIYFDYDKSDITPRAEIELAKVLFAMQEFPNIRIKIESHTDSRGKDEYNRTLSDSRAKSTQNYLIAKGVDSGRIESAIGYGEGRLKNECGNGVKCSEDKHLINRRSDFIIISK